MESNFIIVFLLVLNTIAGFKNCNFFDNSVNVSYVSQNITFGCDKSPNFTMCEMFKDKFDWDQRCSYRKDHTYFKGECPRVKHLGSETRCEYSLENIRKNGNDLFYFNPV